MHYIPVPFPPLYYSQAEPNVSSSTSDRDHNKISIRGFGTPWKTKSWMPGRYNTYTVSPTLGAPTSATSHCYYPIPFVPRELPFVLVFACAAKTVHTLWGSKSASWCPNFPTHWTIPWTPDLPTHGTTHWIPYYPTHGTTYWTPSPFSTHWTPNECTHILCCCC